MGGRKMKDRLTVLFVLLSGAVCLLNPLAEATITKTASGVSAKGVDVTFTAELTILDDELTVVLTNNSKESLNPDDLLGSFYFDIVDDSAVRPNLVYSSAVGDVYLASKTGDEVLQAGTDIMAVDPGDNSWMFATMDEMQNPYLGFGIGTVGNSNLSPNNFSGNIVDGVDYAIYVGDITTQNLDGKLLVKDTATFVFTGLTGFSEADIAPQFAFGLGTAPDSLITPEPATMVLLMMGSLIVRKRKLRKKILQRS